MDGLSPTAALLQTYPFEGEGFPHAGLQQTLKAPIGCVGVGVHSGRRVSLTLHPAAPDTGILFRRTDLDPASDIPARFEHVSDTRLCTVLSDPADPRRAVGTVEHLMAALAGAGIDNARIDVDGPELPILDGSASPFLFLIGCAGIVAQPALRASIEVLRPVRVTDGEAFAELLPADGAGLPDMGRYEMARIEMGQVEMPRFEMSMSIDFDAPAIGRQALSLTLNAHSFRTELAEARTFALAEDIARLHQAGLARGGSLDNAVLVDGARVLNPAGLRMADEFVRHKLLDAVGDLALAGAPLAGRFVAHRSGHALNNRLLHALFADATAWRRIGVWPPEAAGPERAASRARRAPELTLSAA